MPGTSAIHPFDEARRTLQCIHPACNRDAHPEDRFGGFCCGACKKTFEAGTTTKSSNHGPQCPQGPAGQGLNRVGGAPAQAAQAAAPLLCGSGKNGKKFSAAKTVALELGQKAKHEERAEAELGKALAKQRAELQQQQQATAQAREQSKDGGFPTRSRSRSAARSQAPQMQLLVTTLTDDTIRLDVNASYTIDLVKLALQTVTGTPVDQIRLVCGNDELPDGTTTLEELHIEHLSRIIMREPTRLSMPMRDVAVGNPHHYHVLLLELTKSLDEGFAFLTQDYGAWHAHAPLWMSQLVGSNARICVRCRFCGAVLATVCPNSSGTLEAPHCCITMMEAKQGSRLDIETVTFPHGPGMPSIEICVRLSKNLSKKWFATQKLDMRFDLD